MEHQFNALKHEFLQLAEKVDYHMTALEDLRAAEAELSAVVDQTAVVITDLVARLEAVPAADAEIAEVAARLRNLKDVLASHVIA
jgi:hypothetical protein